MEILRQGIRKLGWQFSRFVTVGTMGAVVDFAVYFSLTRGSFFWREYYLWANVVAFFIANAHNFFWHRRWTFGVKGGRRLADYFRFLVASLGYLVIIEGGLLVFTRYLGWYDLSAKVIATGLAVIIYFTVLKLFIFPRNTDRSSPLPKS
ncbi:MAG: GtrA family protein [Patescibacteria group bacterium]